MSLMSQLGSCQLSNQTSGSIGVKFSVLLVVWTVIAEIKPKARLILAELLLVYPEQ